jgi:hypothetical protein
MDQEGIFKIAEGIRSIEKGVAIIQKVMKEKKIKSLSDVAAALIPTLEEHDNQLKEKIISRLKS